MAIGERIRFFRNLRGMTQKYLGVLMGFPEKSADIRMAQYESGSRTPKDDLTNSLAQALEVSPSALNVPDIDSYIGLMHTLFALEDLYGLKIGEVQGEVCLRADVFHGSSAVELNKMLRSWNEVAAKLKVGEITQEEYNAWRYQYPKYDQSGGWTKTPSVQ
ncbi:MAG: helix-turn-helix transcriptional regulator [Oscillospiraceae bacterium]|nr:helix-turn-helix transcriptional regulator [Oscillospiraceae bacterium]